MNILEYHQITNSTFVKVLFGQHTERYMCRTKFINNLLKREKKRQSNRCRVTTTLRRPQINHDTYSKRGEIGRDLTQSYDKTPYTSRNVERAKWQHKLRHKSSITQRLRTDLGRSVGVTTATQLVWLTGLRAQPSNFPQQPCNQKDRHLKICK